MVFVFDGQFPEIFRDRPSRFFTSPQKMPAVQLPSGAKSPPAAVDAACGAVTGAMVPVAEADSGAAASAADGATSAKSAAAETAARKRVLRFMGFLPAGVFGHAKTEGGRNAAIAVRDLAPVAVVARDAIRHVDRCQSIENAGRDGNRALIMRLAASLEIESLVNLMISVAAGVG
ncbi:hypothetical protein D7147_16920 [Micromonospora musae]|uniref:Uncharacterized protein n=1 Tax=Micromonospora musae TaxID=1894970 RepID=A0ABX9R704_9ACTN|nr:hypothetical protein D7147_16920 [Micromonospora musae]